MPLRQIAMPWFSAKEEEKKPEVYFSAVDGLKKLYKSKILPVEDLYKYNAVNSPALT
jgi:hypothetical protein